MKKTQTGFSLVEIAFALLIMGLLLGGLLGPLSAQLEAIKISETQKQLSTITDALYGFAATNRRLPCPASGTSNGGESLGSAPGQCSNPYDGFVPGRLLGLGPVDSNGYITDAWGQPIRYAVADLKAANGSYPLTVDPSEIDSYGIKFMVDGQLTGMAAFGNLTPNGTNPAPSSSFLSICNTATGLANPGSTFTTSGKIRTCGTSSASNVVSSDAVALVLSTGPNRGTASGGDEAANNTGADAVFVWHTRTETGAAGGQFDDLMVWIPRSLLVNKMITAGQLP